MKVYVAASSQEMPRARAVITAIREAGHEITHDWVEVIEGVGSANPENASVEECRKWAQEDFDGVYHADVVVFLAPNKGTAQGAFTEFGYALGLIRAGQFNRKTMVVKAPTCHSIFQSAADYILTSDVAILKALQLVQEQR
jgi:hypothetical protein